VHGHGHNLANNIRGEGAKPTMGVRNLNLRRDQVKKKEKNGSNQSLTYSYTFPHSHPNFYLLLSNSVASTTLFLGRKNMEGLLSPHPPVMSVTTVFGV